MIRKTFSFIRRQELDARLAIAHAEIEELRQELLEQRQLTLRAAEILDLVEDSLLHHPASGA